MNNYRNNLIITDEDEDEESEMMMPRETEMKPGDKRLNERLRTL